MDFRYYVCLFFAMAMLGGGAAAAVIDFNPPGALGGMPGNESRMTLDSRMPVPGGGKALNFKISKRSGEPNSMASTLYFPAPLDFKKGQQYRIRFQARSSQPFSLLSAVKQQAKPWAYVGPENSSSGTFELDSRWKEYVLFFTATADWRGKDVTIAFFYGNLPQGKQWWLGPITVEELSDNQPLDLKNVVNFGFADEIAKDGKGGWTDQGANNDFANFPFHVQWFSQIPFTIIDPAKNSGKAILSFDFEQVRNGLKKVEIAVPRPRRYLYLLHATAWTPPVKTAIGKIHFINAKGQDTVSEVVTERDVADWWMPRYDLPNGKAALEVANGSNKVGVYVSAFSLPPDTRKIVLETTGKSAWMVVAATLADFEAYAEKQEIELIAAGKEWREIDTGDLYIQPGTALDFSATKPNAPCGDYGRIVINRDGKLAFAQRQDEPLRLQGFVEQPIGLLWWPNPVKKEQLDAYAAAVARQGYRLLRLHMVEVMLMFRKNGSPREGKLFDKPEDIPLVPENVDYFNYLIYCLKKHGIYVVLDVFGSSSGYTGTGFFSDCKTFDGFRDRMYYQPQYRANWQAGVTRLLTMPNPYTKMTLAQDPIVAFLHLNNEQHFTWADEHVNGLDPLWREWARKHGIANPPPLGKAASERGDAIADQMNHFLSDREIELEAWYEQVIRDLGYKGLINNWNNTSPLRRIPPRAMLQVVSQNIYFSHPLGYLSPGATISQASTISATWDFSGMMRFLDRPFGATEYAGPAFWTRYRHEQGIRFGSYVTLQDWDFLCMHASAVNFQANTEIQPFWCGYDPIIRAAEVFTHFAYARGYVKKSPHRIAYPVNDDMIFSGHAQDGFDLIFGQLFFLCKTGLLYQGKNSPDAVKITPDMLVSPVGGAVLTDHGMFETAKAGAPSLVTQNAIDKVVSQMRQRGILPPGNQTDRAKGVFQSDTGEITTNTRNQTMTVITPRLEAAAIKQNRPVQLKQMQVMQCSVPAAVSAISLDETKTLTESPRLLVIFATDALNAGMSFTTSHRTELIDRGKLPILLETGHLLLSINSNAYQHPVAYALKLNGTRADKIPVRQADGKLYFEVDTAQLPGGPTPFFEIVEEKQE